MSFLDKINAQNVATAEKPSTKKVNPLLKKKKTLDTKSDTGEKKVLPLKKKLAAKSEEVQEKVKATEEVVEQTAAETKAEEKVAETKKEIKEVEATKTSDDEVLASENKEGPKKEAEMTKKSTAKKEESEEKVEDKAKEEVKEEPKEEAKADKKAENKEEAKEEKPAAKKTTTRKKTSSRAKKETEALKEVELVDIPTTNMSFTDAVAAITSPFIDEEWETFKNEIQEELGKIVISDDLNPGTLKVTISELSILREKIWFAYQETKNLYDHLSSKDPEGLIERIKRINLGSGNNDMERRKAGVLACMNYETDAGNVNLYELLDETRSRYNFLKAIMESIKYKTDVLITMNGALKLEKEHL